MSGYQINLVNQTATTQTFAVFLAPPPELDGIEVFPVSSALIAVAPNQSEVVTVPVSYVVGAGASNEFVGMDVMLDPSLTLDAAPGQSLSANYTNSPPNAGPALVLADAPASPGTIAIATNDFDMNGNEDDRWFASQWFGISTETGFIGMVWSPDPEQTVALTPTPTFLVAVGDFAPNQTTSFGEIAQVATTLHGPTDFPDGQATVTAVPTGGVRLVGPGQA